MRQKTHLNYLRQQVVRVYPDNLHSDISTLVTPLPHIPIPTPAHHRFFLVILDLDLEGSRKKFAFSARPIQRFEPFCSGRGRETGHVHCLNNGSRRFQLRSMVNAESTSSITSMSVWASVVVSLRIVSYLTSLERVASIKGGSSSRENSRRINRWQATGVRLRKVGERVTSTRSEISHQSRMQKA